jgi:hypothetical protein
MIQTLGSIIVKVALLTLLLANMGCALAAGAALAGGVGSLVSGLAAGKGYDSNAGGIEVKDQQEANAMVEKMRADRQRKYNESQAASAAPAVSSPGEP